MSNSKHYCDMYMAMCVHVNVVYKRLFLLLVGHGIACSSYVRYVPHNLSLHKYGEL